jgi:prophage antirepressor-like protein
MSNGFEKQSLLNEDNFGAKGSIVSAFDAFRTLMRSKLPCEARN